MGRIKKSQIEQQPADLQSVEWINTPFAIAKFGKGFSLIQQQALIKVSEALQGYIRDFYNEKRNLSGENPLGLFRKEVLTELEPIRMYASDFGVPASHYAEVFEAFKVISQTQVKAPQYDEDGNYIKTDWYNVFSHFSMPETDKGYTYTDKETGEKTTVTRYEGWADFTINPNVAAHAFNMAGGYVNHPARIAMDSKLSYAPLLYFLIKHSAGSKSKVRVPYSAVQEMLGTVVKDKKTGEVLSNSFPLFSKFKQRVLNKVQEEIKRMADVNQIDITFEYEPIYRGKVSRGDPEYIEFTIQLSDLGKFHNGLLQMPDGTPRRGRPRKAKVDDTPSLFDGVGEEPDYPTQILAALRAAFGNGQQGYDYWFGKRAKASVNDSHTQVVLVVPASVKDSLKASAMLMEKIHRSVAEVMGHECEVLVV